MSWWWDGPKPKKSWNTRNKQGRSGSRKNKGLGGGNLCVVAFIIRIYKLYRRL